MVIIDIENNYNKRIISEMLHIKKQNKGINFQKDTDLDDSYCYLLKNRQTNKQISIGYS